MDSLETLHRIYSDSGSILKQNGYLEQLFEVCARQHIMYAATGSQAPTRAVLLGLGRVSRSEAQAYGSCTQLHTFMYLLETFDIAPSNARIHDPAFNDIDVAFVRSLGLDVPDSSADALDQLICQEPTLVVLPFLPFPVIELVLYQNWRPDLLKNLTLVCNELDGWLNHGGWRRQILQEVEKSENWAFIPRIDRTLSLLDRNRLPALNMSARQTAADSEAEDPLSRVWHSLLNFTFMWMPLHRVHALGDFFWRIHPDLECQHGAEKQLKSSKKERQSKL